MTRANPEPGQVTLVLPLPDGGTVEVDVTPEVMGPDEWLSQWNKPEDQITLSGEWLSLADDDPS